MGGCFLFCFYNCKLLQDILCSKQQINVINTNTLLAPIQVGLNDLTLVNLHLTPLPSVGENAVKNHDSHKLAAFAQTLQETLKGKAMFFFSVNQFA